MDVNNESPSVGSTAVVDNPTSTTGEGLMPTPNAAAPEMPAMSEGATPTGPVVGAAPFGNPDTTAEAGAMHQTMLDQKAQAATEPKKPGFFSRLLGKSPVQVSFETPPLAATPDHLTANADGKLETPSMPNVTPDATSALNAAPTSVETPVSPAATIEPAMPSLDSPTPSPEITTPTPEPSQTQATESPSLPASDSESQTPSAGLAATPETPTAPLTETPDSMSPTSEPTKQEPSALGASPETVTPTGASQDLQTPTSTLPETPSPNMNAQASVTPTVEAPAVPQFNNDALSEKPTTDVNAPLPLESTPPPPVAEDPNKWMTTPSSESSSTANTDATPNSDPLAVTPEVKTSEQQASTVDPLAVGPTSPTPTQPEGLTAPESTASTLPEAQTMQTQTMPSESTSPLGSSIPDSAAQTTEDTGASSLSGMQAPDTENPTVAAAGEVANTAMTSGPTSENLPPSPLGSAVDQANSVVASMETTPGTMPATPSEIQTNEPVATGGGTQTQ